MISSATWPRRMRELIRSGYLGGAPVHMESTFCYELGQTYARALFSDRQHWIRQLPGKLLAQHYQPRHCASCRRFSTSESPDVVAYGFTSPFLRSVGETEIVDELRVIIADEGRCTAYFTFSSQMRPLMHQFSVYGPTNGSAARPGPRNSAEVARDKLQELLGKAPSSRHLRPTASRESCANARAFLGNDFHAKAGMYHLIQSFYRSITEGTPVPIPYREIVLTATIMDRIFKQLELGHEQFEERFVQAPCETTHARPSV